MKISSKICYLAYGVVKKAAESPPNTSLSNIDFHDISLFYKNVPSGEFGEKYLIKNLNDIEWVERNIVEFQDQINNLNQQSPILPFKFGTVYNSKKRMKTFLESYYRAFIENFNFLTGKSEWGVKVFFSQSLFHKWLLLKTGDILPVDKDKSAGTAFFERKKQEYKVIEQEGKFLNRILQEFREKIKRIAYECKETEFIAGFGETGYSFKPIYSLAGLVENDKSIRLHSLTNGLTKQYKGKGIILRLSGPWPPYNFVKI